MALAALAFGLALATGPIAALSMAVAAMTGYWAWTAFREQPRVHAAPQEFEIIDISDLAPLLEALPDPALLMDAEGRIAGSNAAVRRQLRAEPNGQFLSSVMRQPDVLDAARAAVRNGETQAVEYESSNQVDRSTRCNVSPLTWGDERAALLVFHDQTARMNTERMRADFLANASHELRTPLASLTLLIETIAGPARDNAAERDRFLKMMQVQADRMRRLIDDLLSLSRIELDEHVPPSDRADLALVARESVDALATVAQERNVKVDLRVPGGPLPVIGERFQLTQVIQNLVDNALKYTPEGGQVVVTVAAAGDRDDVMAKAGRQWPDAGRITLLTPGPAANLSYAYVRVEDSGAGIARRFLPRLAERFFRVEREEGNDRGGTGLGLAIVKHIVNRHRGGFLVESQPGRGSAFAVFVELAEQD
ncbi:MAG TPA: ATP-binding protein [Vitreimonas sp.]|jgi:two-component system phosphate regulon sensor histidine kinase PhoR|nr:ATP-binding protein [Vitreimonas sp.]